MKFQRTGAAFLVALSASAHADIPVGFVPNATPTDWVWTVPNPGDGSNTGYSNYYGSITFNDWGYKGPTGVGANDFKVGSGFDAGKLGQIQSVVTKNGDPLCQGSCRVYFLSRRESGGR